MITPIFLLPAFVLAWVAYGALRERLDDAAIPASLRGIPILLVSTGFLSMAIAGLAGGNRSPSMFVGLFIATSSGFLAAAIGQGAKKTAPATVEQIDRLLPQTQCGQCGYPGCKPYANAIASGEADINQCPPGGEAGVRALAQLLGRPVKPLNPDNGIEKPRVVALIREPECIGCTKCIQACPVDAIIGASKSMHVVIADLCTGCELCVPPCPVDCIDLVLVTW